MRIFKSLFGKKKESEPKIEIANSCVKENGIEAGTSTNNIQDLVLLFFANTLIVGGKANIDYLRDKFGISFPNEKLNKLANAGLIRPTTAFETLPHLKLTELKDIASRFGLKVTGKKDDICSRIIENASETNLIPYISERYWFVTDSGKSLLDQNKYIMFYMEKHPYSLEAIGLDIYTYSKLFSGKENRRVRDILWGEFNHMSTRLYNKGVSKGEFREYCALLRIMALFLEEENRHNDAFAMYLRFLYYRVNFEASLPAIRQYSITKDIDSAALILFVDSEIMPFIANEFLHISDACGYNSATLKAQLCSGFSKEEDTGTFSPAELAEYIMLGLNSDRDGQQDYCKSIMKAAAKKIPRR